MSEQIEIFKWNPELDVPAIAQMGKHFIEHSPTGAWMGGKADQATLERVILYLLEHAGTSTVIKAVAWTGPHRGLPVGFLALCSMTNPWTLQTHVEECGFWVYPDYRRTRAAHWLLGAGEEWARQVGAAVLKMAAPPRSGFSRWLQRNGYELVEETHVKRLGDGADASIQSGNGTRRERAHERRDGHSGRTRPLVREAQGKDAPAGAGPDDDPHP